MDLQNEVVSLRRLVRIQGLAMLAGLAVVGVLAAKRADVPDKIEAHSFVVDDTNGHAAATLGFRDGAPILSMTAPNSTDGSPSVLLTAMDSETGLRLGSANTPVAVDLIVAKGVTALSLEQDSHARWMVGAAADSKTTESFFDKDGNNVFMQPPASH